MWNYLVLSLVFSLGCSSTVDSVPIDGGDVQQGPRDAGRPDAPGVIAEGFDYVPCAPDGGVAAGAEPCGPTAPCRVVADEVVATGEQTSSPALTLRGGAPVIAFGVPDDAATPAQIATRDSSGGWTTHPIDHFDFVYLSNEQGGGITLGGDDAPYDSRFAPLAGDALGAPADSTAGIAEAPVVRDACGRAHAVVRDESRHGSVVGYLSPGGGGATTWLQLTIGDAHLALAPNGDLHLVAEAYSATYDPVFRWYVNGAMRSEAVVPFQPLGDFAFGVATRDGATVPHLLYPGISNAPRVWSHAWMDASGAWQQEAVFVEDRTHDCIETRTAAEGQTCDEDFTEHDLIGTATSDAGATRWLMLTTRTQGSYVSECTGGGGGPADAGPSCRWAATPSASVTTSIEVLWLEGDQLQHAAVSGTAWTDPSVRIYAGAGGARIDASGAIHLAYIASPSGSTGTIRHLVIGP